MKEVTFSMAPAQAKQMARELMLIGNYNHVSPREYRYFPPDVETYVLCAVTEYLRQEKKDQQFWFDQGVLIGLA